MTNCRERFRRANLRLALRPEHVLAVTRVGPAPNASTLTASEVELLLPQRLSRSGGRD